MSEDDVYGTRSGPKVLVTPRGSRPRNISGPEGGPVPTRSRVLSGSFLLTDWSSLVDQPCLNPPSLSEETGPRHPFHPSVVEEWGWRVRGRTDRRKRSDL